MSYEEDKYRREDSSESPPPQNRLGQFSSTVIGHKSRGFTNRKQHTPRKQFGRKTQGFNSTVIGNSGNLSLNPRDLQRNKKSSKNKLGGLSSTMIQPRAQTTKKNSQGIIIGQRFDFNKNRSSKKQNSKPKTKFLTHDVIEEEEMKPYFRKCKVTKEFKKRKDCKVCSNKFGLRRKQYYCRFCGHGVCKKCSQKKRPNPKLKTIMEKICITCSYKEINYKMTRNMKLQEQKDTKIIELLEKQLYSLKKDKFNHNVHLEQNKLKHRQNCQKYEEITQQIKVNLAHVDKRVKEYTDTNEKFNHKLSEAQNKHREQQDKSIALQADKKQKELMLKAITMNFEQQESQLLDIRQWFNHYEQFRNSRQFDYDDDGTSQNIEDYKYQQYQAQQMQDNYYDEEPMYKQNNTSNYMTENSLTKKKKLFQNKRGNSRSNASNIDGSLLDGKGCCSMKVTGKNKKCMIF